MEHDHERPDHHLGPRFPDYDPGREQQRAEQAADTRRIAREEAFANSGLVAGHDFKREHAEHERERGR